MHTLLRDYQRDQRQCSGGSKVLSGPLEDSKQAADDEQGDHRFGQMQKGMPDDLKSGPQGSSGNQKQKHLHGAVSESGFRIDNLRECHDQRRNNEITASAGDRKGSYQ